MSPPRTDSDALVEAREWLPAIAQLERVRAERDALEADQKALERALCAAAQILFDVTGRLCRQQHELTGRPRKVTRLL